MRLVFLTAFVFLAGFAIGWYLRDRLPDATPLLNEPLNEPIEARSADLEAPPGDSLEATPASEVDVADLAAALERGEDPLNVLDRLERMERELSAGAHLALRARVLDVAERWTRERMTLQALPLLEGYRSRYVQDGRAGLMLADVYQMVGLADSAFPVLFDVVAYPADAGEAQRARDRIRLLEQANAALLANRRDTEGLVRFYQRLLGLDPGNDEYRIALAEWQIALATFADAADTLRGVMDDPNGRAARLVERVSLGTKGVAVRTRGDQLLADVEIAGGMMTLLVDTGATHTSLEAGALRALNAERIGEAIAVRTAAGTVDLPVYRVSDVALGVVVLPSLEVLQLDADLPGVDGLLGMDLLRRVGLANLKSGVQEVDGTAERPVDNLDQKR